MSDRIPRRRLRWWLYEQIDRLDTYCMKHLWVPTWIQVRVGRAWQWTFKDNITLTAVGDDIPNPFERPGGETPVQTVDEAYPVIYFDRCYISGCQCGKPRYERQTDDDERGWGCGQSDCKACY